MQRISWIGVGIMGKAMVRNLMKAGYEVHIYARHPEKVADVISEGAVPHGSIAECVKASEVVITMVGFPKDVEEVYFAPGNILDSAAKGMTLIDMTTTSPTLKFKVSMYTRVMAMVMTPVNSWEKPCSSPSEIESMSLMMRLMMSPWERLAV